MKVVLAFTALAGACAAALGAEIPRAPEGTFSDRANLITADAARMRARRALSALSVLPASFLVILRSGATKDLGSIARTDPSLRSG